MELGGSEPDIRSWSKMPVSGLHEPRPGCSPEKSNSLITRLPRPTAESNHLCPNMDFAAIGARKLLLIELKRF